jgi:uncharacterized protein DUF642/PEP-CTERM motif-containing protein
MRPVLCAAALALAASANALGANLLTDGSFESPTVPAGGFSNFGTGTTIGGWTVVGPQASIVSGSFSQDGISFPAEDGLQWVDLTGDGSNSLEGLQQSVATVPGHTYLLSFWVGNVNNPGGIFGTTSSVDLEINGAPHGTFTNSCASCTSTQAWQQFTTSFVASGATTMVTFLNEDGPADNSNGLDNVVLTGQAAGVPEPATLSLLVLGLAGTFWPRRRATR